MNVVTGISGFVGSHLARYMLQRGEKVAGICRAGSDKKLVEDVAHLIEWRTADLLDVHAMCDVINDGENIYHCAGLVSYERKMHNEMMHLNIAGTANLVNAALEKTIGKFLFISSVAALGRPSQARLIDEQLQWEPSPYNTKYAISKQYAEREVWRGMAEGLNVVVLNPSVIIGPGIWRNGSSKIFNHVHSGMKYYASGANGFVDVRDVVRIAAELMQSEFMNERFVVSAQNWSYKMLAEKIADELGVSRPQKELTPAKAKIAGWIEEMRSYISKEHKPLFTRDAAKLSMYSAAYDNKKLLHHIPFSYRELDATIKETAAIFGKTIAKGYGYFQNF